MRWLSDLLTFQIFLVLLVAWWIIRGCSLIHCMKSLLFLSYVCRIIPTFVICRIVSVLLALFILPILLLSDHISFLVKLYLGSLGSITVVLGFWFPVCLYLSHSVVKFFLQVLLVPRKAYLFLAPLYCVLTQINLWVLLLQSNPSQFWLKTRTLKGDPAIILNVPEMVLGNAEIWHE